MTVRFLRLTRLHVQLEKRIFVTWSWFTKDSKWCYMASQTDSKPFLSQTTQKQALYLQLRFKDCRNCKLLEDSDLYTSLYTPLSAPLWLYGCQKPLIWRQDDKALTALVALKVLKLKDLPEVAPEVLSSLLSSCETGGFTGGFSEDQKWQIWGFQMFPDVSIDPWSLPWIFGWDFEAILWF